MFKDKFLDLISFKIFNQKLPENSYWGIFDLLDERYFFPVVEEQTPISPAGIGTFGWLNQDMEVVVGEKWPDVNRCRLIIPITGDEYYIYTTGVKHKLYVKFDTEDKKMKKLYLAGQDSSYVDNPDNSNLPEKVIGFFSDESKFIYITEFGNLYEDNEFKCDNYLNFGNYNKFLKCAIKYLPSTGFILAGVDRVEYNSGGKEYKAYFKQTYKTKPLIFPSVFGFTQKIIIKEVENNYFKFYVLDEFGDKVTLSEKITILIMGEV